MKYPSDHTRTTLTLDEKTVDYLKFIEKYHHGILWAIDRATRFFRLDYISKRPFLDGSTVQVDRSNSILDHAKKLQDMENSEKSNKSLRNVRKSVVIDKATLASVNKIAKANQIKRDFVFISAIKQERDSMRKLLKFRIELNRKFLETKMKPMCAQLESNLNWGLNKTEEFMKTNSIYDFDFIVTWDVESGLTTPYTTVYESFVEAIAETDKYIADWEDML